MGMPLQPAERMAALKGPWSAFASELKSIYLPSDDCELIKHLNVERSRSRDFLMMAQILMATHELPGRCDFTTQRVDKFLHRVDPPSESFKVDVRATLDKYLLVAPKVSKKKIAPVEFIMVAVLIHGKPDLAPDRVGNLVNEFRTHMKQGFEDLRINSKQITAAYDWLETHG